MKLEKNKRPSMIMIFVYACLLENMEHIHISIHRYRYNLKPFGIHKSINWISQQEIYEFVSFYYDCYLLKLFTFSVVKGMHALLNTQFIGSNSDVSITIQVL